MDKMDKMDWRAQLCFKIDEVNAKYWQHPFSRDMALAALAAGFYYHRTLLFDPTGFHGYMSEYIAGYHIALRCIADQHCWDQSVSDSVSDQQGWDSDQQGWDSDQQGWDQQGWDSDQQGWDSDQQGWDSDRQGWDSDRQGWDQEVSDQAATRIQRAFRAYLVRRDAATRIQRAVRTYLKAVRFRRAFVLLQQAPARTHGLLARIGHKQRQRGSMYLRPILAKATPMAPAPEPAPEADPGDVIGEVVEQPPAQIKILNRRK
jgi:hypothetical protein